MARGKKKEELTLEGKLDRALAPVEEQPYEVPENWCWKRLKHIEDGFQYGCTEKATYESVPYCKTSDEVSRLIH